MKVNRLTLNSLKAVFITLLFVFCNTLNAAESTTNSRIASSYSVISNITNSNESSLFSLFEVKELIGYYNNSSTVKKYTTGWWWNRYFFKKKKKRRKKKGHKKGTSIPLDGGLSILLLGATAFGVKKLYRKK